MAFVGFCYQFITSDDDIGSQKALLRRAPFRVETCWWFKGGFTSHVCLFGCLSLCLSASRSLCLWCIQLKETLSSSPFVQLFLQDHIAHWFVGRQIAEFLNQLLTFVAFSVRDKFCCSRLRMKLFFVAYSACRSKSQPVYMEHWRPNHTTGLYKMSRFSSDCFIRPKSALCVHARKSK